MFIIFLFCQHLQPVKGVSLNASSDKHQHQHKHHQINILSSGVAITIEKLMTPDVGGEMPLTTRLVTAEVSKFVARPLA